MAQVKKLSVATVYGKVDVRAVLNASKPICVMKVGGQAVGIKTGQSNYGEWTALIGSFIAFHPESGEQFEASQLFLPEVALIPIRVALSQQGSRAVDFAIDLFVKPSNNAKPGGSPYEYTFESRVAPSETDPLARMRALLLEGPKPDAANDKGSDTDADKGSDKPADKQRRRA